MPSIIEQAEFTHVPPAEYAAAVIRNIQELLEQTEFHTVLQEGKLKVNLAAPMESV
jgi:hypothetical protein